MKAIVGTRDAFLRYRVGNYPLLYEVLEPQRMVLVSAIVARKDLERWIRRQRS